MTRYATISDCYNALLDLGGGIESLITQDELRDIIHAENFRYEDITPGFLGAVWYSLVRGGEYKIGSWSGSDDYETGSWEQS